MRQVDGKLSFIFDKLSVKFLRLQIVMSSSSHFVGPEETGFQAFFGLL